MEDFIVIASILTVFGLGFIPVFFLCRFVNRIRKPVIDKSKHAQRETIEAGDFENDPVSEFESTGEVFFRQK